MTHWRLSNPRTVGGFDQSAGSRHGQHYAPLPANSILTPDDPPASELSDGNDRGWLALLGVGFGLLMFGFYLLFTT